MSKKSKKVLIIDDEIGIIEILQALLEEHFPGIEICTSLNGLDAYLMCEKETFNLIITDHKMPFMTGAAFIVALKTKENLNQNTNVIMLSGFLDNDLKEKMTVQNVEFLEKPFDESQFINLVTSYLS